MAVPTVQWSDVHPSKTKGWKKGGEQLVVVRQIETFEGEDEVIQTAVGYIDGNGNINVYTNGCSVGHYDEIEADFVIEPADMQEADKWWEWSMM